MEFSRQEYWSGLPCPPSRGSSPPRDRTWVSRIAGGFFTTGVTREAPTRYTYDLRAWISAGALELKLLYTMDGATMLISGKKWKHCFYIKMSMKLYGSQKYFAWFSKTEHNTSKKFALEDTFSLQGLPWWLSDKESACNLGDRFNTWAGKIPWRRKWQPNPVFLPGESHGQGSLLGYSPGGHSD